MLSRALSLATVTLLTGCLAASSAHAQATNLEAGKSPSQIFAQTCTVCHKTGRGLLKTVPPGSLAGFLRQHYTTSPEMAGVLASFLISNGATDTRYGGGQAKPDKDAKSEARPGGPPEQLDRQGRRIRAAIPPAEPAAKPEAEPQQAAKPDVDGLGPQGEAGRKGRNARRLARPAEEGTKPAEGEAAARETSERGPDGRKLGARQRLGKRGKPGEEMPKGETGKEEPAAAAVKDDKPAGETAKEEAVRPPVEGKSETPSSEISKPETAKIEPPKEPAGQTPALRPDPVPPVTPAPASAPAAAATPEPAATAVAKPAPPVTPSVPQSAAPASDGSPMPPISR